MEGAKGEPSANGRRWTLEITGMTCGDCARSVDRSLRALDGVHESATSYETKTSVVIASPAVTQLDLTGAVTAHGYGVARIGSSDFESVVEGGTFDLAIIGTGGAGMAAAIRAAESGKRVAIIDAGTLGGTCVNIGCVPSKTLIRAAEARHRAQRSAFAGVTVSAGPTDLAALIAQKDLLVAELRGAKYAAVLDALPSVTRLRGRARFAPPGTLLVDDAPLDAAKILIATGSSPAIPAIDGLRETPFVTSQTLMELTSLPEHLIVLGAGYVGLELGQAFARLGSRVTVLARSRLLSGEDPDLGDELARLLRAEGLDVRTQTSADRVRYAGGFAVDVSGPDGPATLSGDQLLVATGRAPNTGGLGLGEIGVELTARGELVVDEHLRTTREHIYGAGDVIGDPTFVYVAAYAGNLAADNAVNGAGRTVELDVVPQVTFTDPAVATVGLTEAQARARGFDVMVSKLAMSHVPRAIAARDTRGFIKLVADRADKRFLGAQILAPEAGELIQPIVMAMKFGVRTDQLASLLFPYLTATEGLKLAAQTFDKDVSKLSCCAA